MKISNIDDLLMGTGNSQQPTTPEHKDKLEDTQAPEQDDEIETPTYETEDDDAGDDETADDEENAGNDNDESDDEKLDRKANNEEDEIDEYGNKKERMSKGMKDRLDRKERQHRAEMEQQAREIAHLRQQLQQQGASKEVQQAVKDFKYDPNEEVPWEQQLSDFVKHTVKNMHQDEQKQARLQQEQAAEEAFAKKFKKDMQRFYDFREVVGPMPIDDAMTLALRGMSDPSAFIYAASKRQPGELERISKLSDPYARMVEMGKLEERMRRNKPTTKAPRPLGRAKEDAPTKPASKQKDMTGDDLLAKADAKRLATVRNRHKSNR